MRAYKTIVMNELSGIGTIWLNRPEVHNAFNPEMISEVNDAVIFFQEKIDIRLIIIRARGKSFSSGADLNYMKELAGADLDVNLSDAKKLAEMFFTIHSCPKPLVTVLHGNVTGGANGIVAASDIALAETGTVFRFSEVHLGLVPATISPYLVRKIGLSASKDLMLTGRSFNAAEALRLSLVNYTFEPEDLDKILNGILKNLLLGGPDALSGTKKILNGIVNRNIDSGLLEFTSNAIAFSRASDEGKEGISAFFEKRRTLWQKDLPIE